MQAFQFKGFTGLLLMFFMVSAVLFFIVIFPSMIFTALWNATIYGMLDGAKIGITQGMMVWAIVVMSYLLWLKPDIQIKLASMDDIDEADMPPMFAKEDKPPSKDTKLSEHGEHWHKWRKAQEEAKKNEKPS
jgi:hypothetical protein